MSEAKQVHPDLLELCRKVTAKRPKTVIDHILKYGFVTTEELKNTYGYDHPPRAVRDVKEHGIPIETFRVVGKNGRKIAAYRFGEWKGQRVSRLEGRTALSKEIKRFLVDKYGNKCFIYLEKVNENELQIDHRIPYEVGGDNADVNPENFMLLSGSANRAKSWSCEQCQNWKILKQVDICRSCYWAYPENYHHIAMRQIRRLDVLWQDSEVFEYDELKQQAESEEKELPAFVKAVLRAKLRK